MGLKTIIIGGGRGCRSIIGLLNEPIMDDVKLDIVGVADINVNAPGLLYAEDAGLKTYTDITAAISHPGLDLVIEMTGQDEILQQLYKIIKPGIKIIDHEFTHIFWELLNSKIEQNWHIEELAKLEKTIEKESVFLQQIFDSSADIILVLDTQRKIIRANAKFYEYIDVPEDKVLGLPSCDVLRGSALDCSIMDSEDKFEELIKTGVPQSFIRKTPPPDEVHWEINRTPILNSKGEVDRVLSTWHKITERVMLRREIESAESRFKSFINSAQDWISIKDLSGRYLIANPVTAKAFDMLPEDFIGKKPEDILPGKLSKTINQHDAAVVASSKHQTFTEVIPIHGVDHHFQTVRFPLSDYRGEMMGVCTIARDVTNEMKLKEQLVQSEKLAALGKLAAGVAHEINNPLTGILAYAEDLALEFPEDSDYHSDLQVIIRETLRCRDIVRNLLDFSRQDKPKFQEINPNTILENAMNLIKKLPQFKDIEIIESFSQNLPNIQSDPQQIVQVALNFMLNAADAMKYKGSIEISTDYRKNLNKCIISVEDNGPGIPENLIDKIFEPFFSTKGTNGLGLAVSWGIIERHKGTIEVDMADSGGAVFSIILPCYRKNEREEI